MEPTMEEIERVRQLFKVLSDRTRLKIVLSLKDGERNVTAIAESLVMEQSAISHQLKLLRDSNVVKSRREGKTIYYSLDDEHILDIIEQTFRHVHHV